MRLFEKIIKLLGCGICFQAVFFYYCVAVLALPNFLLAFTEPVSAVTRVCNVLFPTAVFLLMMTLTSRPGRMFFILLIFVFLNAFELVLLYLFGESVIAVDMFLNLVTTNAEEVSEMLGNIMPSIVLVLAVYLPGVIGAVCSVRSDSVLKSKFLKKNRLWAVGLLCLATISVVIAYKTDDKFDFVDDVYPVNVLKNAQLAIVRYYKTCEYYKTSGGFSFDAVRTDSCPKREIYIYVIGETARADNFGIFGYRRNTTPCLAEISSLIAFKRSFTQSNTTHKSVPMLLSDITAANYDSIYDRKSIITAFKESGFYTAFFSNQMQNHSFIDFFGSEADEVEYLKDKSRLETNVSDMELIGLVENVIRERTEKRLFIVLHTYGSHFNYSERYSREDAHFKPDSIASIQWKNRKELVNAYDNTIRSTDRFLSELIARLTTAHCVGAIVYTSDHGEDLFDDDRRLFLHASAVPSYYQLHVPLVVWLTDEYRSYYPDKDEALKKNIEKNVLTSEVMFHTLLSIGHIGTKYYDETMSLASRNFKERRLTYLNDHNECVYYDEIGLKNEDFVKFNTIKSLIR